MLEPNTPPLPKGEVDAGAALKAEVPIAPPVPNADGALPEPNTEGAAPPVPKALEPKAPVARGAPKGDKVAVVEPKLPKAAGWVVPKVEVEGAG